MRGFEHNPNPYQAPSELPRTSPADDSDSPDRSQYLQRYSRYFRISLALTVGGFVMTAATLFFPQFFNQNQRLGPNAGESLVQLLVLFISSATALAGLCCTTIFGISGVIYRSMLNARR